MKKRLRVRFFLAQFIMCEVLQTRLTWRNTRSKKKNKVGTKAVLARIRNVPTFSAVMNIFQGIRTPIPCIKNVMYTKWYLSLGVFSCRLASSMVRFLKFNSSSGKLFSSQEGCRRTGWGCFSTSSPATKLSYRDDSNLNINKVCCLNISRINLTTVIHSFYCKYLTNFFVVHLSIIERNMNREYK